MREHLAALRECGVEATTVRQPHELEAVDALVLPGGESTTMSRLLRVSGLEPVLHARLAGGMPLLATCAGLILLARDVLDGRPDQIAAGAFDVAVRRNGYGRQAESFEADIRIDPLGVAPFRGVFIRAPRIESVGGDAQVIATFGENPVAVVQGARVGLVFHPEMTDDPRLHRFFLERAEASLQTSAA